MQDSQIAELKAPMQVDRRDIGNKSGWGDLPPKEREQALQQIGREFPAHYRELVEQYFRELANEQTPAERELTPLRCRSTRQHSPAATTLNCMTPWLAILAAAARRRIRARPTFTKLDGKTVVGTVAAWDGNEITVEDGQRRPEALDRRDCSMRLGQRDAIPSSVDRSVELIDGTRLAYADFTIAKRVATFRLPFAKQVGEDSDRANSAD